MRGLIEAIFLTEKHGRSADRGKTDRAAQKACYQGNFLGGKSDSLFLGGGRGKNPTLCSYVDKT